MNSDAVVVFVHMTVQDPFRLLQHLHQALVFLYQEVIMRFWAIVKDLQVWLLRVPRHGRWFRFYIV